MGGPTTSHDTRRQHKTKRRRRDQGNKRHALETNMVAEQRDDFAASKTLSDYNLQNVYTEYTKHRSHMRLWLKSLTAQDCSVIIGHMKIVPSSGPPCHLLAGLSHIFSLPVYHNTKHNLDSKTLSKTTLYTEHLFQNLFSRPAALTNRSRTSIESGRNPRKTSPTGNEPKELATISGSSLEDIYQFFEVQGEIGEKDQQAPIIEEVKEFGQIGTQSLLDHEMAETSLVERIVPPPVPDALRRVYGKHCRL